MGTFSMSGSKSSHPSSSSSSRRLGDSEPLELLSSTLKAINGTNLYIMCFDFLNMLMYFGFSDYLSKNHAHELGMNDGK